MKRLTPEDKTQVWLVICMSMYCVLQLEQYVHVHIYLYTSCICPILPFLLCPSPLSQYTLKLAASNLFKGQKDAYPGSVVKPFLTTHLSMPIQYVHSHIQSQCTCIIYMLCVLYMYIAQTHTYTIVYIIYTRTVHACIITSLHHYTQLVKRCI